MYRERCNQIHRAVDWHRYKNDFFPRLACQKAKEIKGSFMAKQINHSVTIMTGDGKLMIVQIIATKD